LDYSTLSDEALIHLIVQRRPDAISALYDRYNRLVFSLALNVVGDRETAEEITQDVFYRVWENAESYRSEQAKVTTWMTSITRYRSIDILRKRKTRPESDSLEWAEASSSTSPSTGDGPEEITDLSLQQQRIRLAVSALPPEQQTVLALAFFQGFTHSQIAASLNQPLGTVKTRIRLGMLKLREILEND
jgi:RNA polymerase sigma-70 factor, ECF subfamily